MDAWLQVSFEIPEDLADPVTAVLFELGSVGQELREAASADSIQVVAYFAPHSPTQTTVDRIRAGLADDPQVAEAGCFEEIVIRTERLPEADWSTAWRVHFGPVFPTDRICVCPPWDVPPAPDGGFCIIIEPKMAFGTGHHETTCLALRGVEALVKAGDRVLDVGCGSGVLSIAASKLGAAAVTAIDIDGDAVANTVENLRLNVVSEQVTVNLGSAVDVQGRYDLVVANMISGALIPVLPHIIQRLDLNGLCVLTGILDREEAAFREALGRSGLSVRQVDRAGEWMGFFAEHAR